MSGEIERFPEKVRERELRDWVECCFCGKPFGETGLPIFHRIAIATYGVDLQAVQRQTGLTSFLGGNAAIALAMGPDEPMAERLGDVDVLTLCAACIESAQGGEVGMTAPERITGPLVERSRMSAGCEREER